MSKLIRLTQGKSTIVDDEDFEQLSQNKWHFDGIGYAKRWPSNRSAVAMAREIMNPPKGMEVDHINGNPLDNRRCNLRVCTTAQNQHNQFSRRGRSKYKGVHWHRSSNRWVARIALNGKRHFLGTFLSEIEAAEAYDAAAIKLYGEFANTNTTNDHVLLGGNNDPRLFRQSPQQRRGDDAANQ